MGGLNRRKPETYDLNPSPEEQSKSCKEMGEKLGSTMSLEEASQVATIAQHKIMVT
jgi:hypothetical protein